MTSYKINIDWQHLLINSSLGSQKQFSQRIWFIFGISEIYWGSTVCMLQALILTYFPCRKVFYSLNKSNNLFAGQDCVEFYSKRILFSVTSHRASLIPCFLPWMKETVCNYTTPRAEQGICIFTPFSLVDFRTLSREYFCQKHVSVKHFGVLKLHLSREKLYWKIFRGKPALWDCFLGVWWAEHRGNQWTKNLQANFCSRGQRLPMSLSSQSSSVSSSPSLDYML